MEQERKVKIEAPAGESEEQLKETREFLEEVSAPRESTVPPAQDQTSKADADTLDDAVPGTPD